MSPNLKLQTGWGRNLSLEHRKFTSTMRVQSHRKYIRPEVAAPVCAILTMRHKNRPASSAGCVPFPCTGEAPLGSLDDIPFHPPGTSGLRTRYLRTEAEDG